MSGVSKPYSELYSPVRNDATVLSAVTIRSKNWRGVKLVKNSIKNFFGGI
jgi:hypothetical protein